MLISKAELEGRGRVDVRIEAGRIAQIGTSLASAPGEARLDARGGALLPGLHDHHLHLLALAAARSSLHCGPPRVCNRAQLAGLLQAAEPVDGGWIRGIGYHESVAGSLARRELDAFVPTHPLRIQHRSGALWMLNSAAITTLGLDRGCDAPGVERQENGLATGRLYRLDGWLGEQLQATAPPSLEKASRQLAGYGVTGVTDATPSNAASELALFTSASERGELQQRLLLMGSIDLPEAASERVERGAFKILLYEGALPGFDTLRDQICRAHDQGRAVAIHCVTRAELVFAASVLAAAGNGPKLDRIEHAAVAPPETVELLRERGVHVVTQPNFVRERGDAYLSEVDPADRPWLYRCGELIDAGIPTGGGTDAPFGDPDPWRAMQAAVDRKSAAGLPLRLQERVSPERALALFTSPSDSPGAPPRCIVAGAPADLCLLDRPWTRARDELCSEFVAATFCAGRIIHAAR